MVLWAEAARPCRPPVPGPEGPWMGSVAAPQLWVDVGSWQRRGDAPEGAPAAFGDKSLCCLPTGVGHFCRLRAKPGELNSPWASATVSRPRVRTSGLPTRAGALGRPASSAATLSSGSGWAPACLQSLADCHQLPWSPLGSAGSCPSFLSPLASEWPPHPPPPVFPTPKSAPWPAPFPPPLVTTCQRGHAFASVRAPPQPGHE